MLKSNKNAFIILIMITLSLILYSCYPGDSTEAQDYDLVSTFFDKDADFAGAQTFFVLDSVFHITGDSTKPDSDLLTRKFDRQLLDEVRRNMLDRGYNEIANPDSNNVPDLALRLSATAIENYNIYSYYPYWGYYPGYSWGGYYPWYPWGGATYVTKYTVGTLIIDMSDVRRAESNLQRIPTIWLAGINGLLESTKSSNASRALESINQAFTQSPYLGAK